MYGFPYNNIYICILEDNVVAEIRIVAVGSVVDAGKETLTLRLKDAEAGFFEVSDEITLQGDRLIHRIRSAMGIPYLLTDFVERSPDVIAKDGIKVRIEFFN